MIKNRRSVTAFKNVPGNERLIVCLRKWCGNKEERHLRNRRDAHKCMMSSEMEAAGLVVLRMKTNTGRASKLFEMRSW